MRSSLIKPIISIILPTYNEAGNIVRLIKEIKKNLKEIHFEILVIDDNSPDQTAGIVQKQFKDDPLVKVSIRTKERGLAKSIALGFRLSQGKYVLVMDTDFNHEPKMIPHMLLLKKDYDLIVGSRYVKGGGMENKLRYFLSYIYNLLIRFVLRLQTYDNLSGFFLIDKKSLNVILRYPIFYGYGDYFIRFLYIAHRNKFRIKEMPVFYKNRSAGESKSKFISMFIDYSKTVLHILFQK